MRLTSVSLEDILNADISGVARVRRRLERRERRKKEQRARKEEQARAGQPEQSHEMPTEVFTERDAVKAVHEAGKGRTLPEQLSLDGLPPRPSNPALPSLSPLATPKRDTESGYYSASLQPMLEHVGQNVPWRVPGSELSVGGSLSKFN